MEALRKAVENRKAPFEFGGKTGTRGRVISLRVSERMEQLLEEQAQEWNMSTSDTLRSVLNFYFLPPLLLEAWENKVEEALQLNFFFIVQPPLLSTVLLLCGEPPLFQLTALMLFCS